MKFWHNYPFKNLTLVGISFVVALFLLLNESFRNVLLHLGGWGYLGAFLAGILFVCTFTISIGAAILYIIANNELSAWEIAIFAGLGGVVFDFIIFQSVRNEGLVEEIQHIFDYLGGNRINHLIKTKYFAWTLPVIGAILIALPLPDELGVSLMGISKMKPWKFILLAFALDFIGVFIVVSAARLI